MLPTDHSPTLPARLLLRAGLLLWLVGCVALAWEVLTRQAPGSPYQIGLLSGPVEQLRNGAFALGAGLLAGGLLHRWLFGERGLYWALLATVAATVHVAALLYCAWHGLAGVQILDPRPGTAAITTARAVAHLLTMVALSDAFVRALRRPR